MFAYQNLKRSALIVGTVNECGDGLKEPAAKLGANGILLRETGDQITESVTYKRATGIAIHVAGT